MFNFAAHHAQSDKRYYRGADLVMEVVSDDEESRDRDLNKKRLDYAAGGIPEYWIVDPQEKQISILALAGQSYERHGVFRDGQQATSKLLPGFSVDVTAVFNAAAA